ncbi:MAG: Fic family protein [Ruminococcus flavefaciens]|nr:Fic family protein [Ruminococcus flavefaciens]
MRKFDYSFLRNGAIPAKFMGLAAGIGEMKAVAADRKRVYTDAFEELEKIAKVQSVKSSNAIEGIITSDSRIQEIVNHSSAPLNHDEAEIAGYRDALNRIHSDFRRLDLSEKDILSLHSTLLSYTTHHYGGRFKETDNVIMEIDATGNRRVRFRPTSAEETPVAIEQWILAYLEARQDSGINPLLLIPCVILDFLCIHPFSDGNGRMSRLLSLLLLYKEGYDVVKYISYEEQINKYKDLYYESLRISSIGWDRNENDYFAFAENFIFTLLRCYRELDMRFSVVNGKKLPKNKRIEETLKNSITPLSKADLCKVLPDVSPSTVESVLGQLVRKGFAVKIGTSRNTRYIYNK